MYAVKSQVINANMSRFGLLSGGLILAPLLPFWAYWNGAYWWVAGILLLVLGWWYTGNKSEPAFSFSIKAVDTGFLLLSGGALLHLLSTVYSDQTLPAKGQYLNFILVGLTYISASVFVTKNKISWRSWIMIPFTALTLTTVFVVWKSWQVHFSYASLTSALSYEKGWGNISQLAMHASFYIILVFFLAKRKSVLLLSALMAAALTYVLDSKMLGLVLICCVLASLTQQVDLRRKMLLVFGGLIGGILLIVYVQPTFLSGRLDLWTMLLANIGPEYIWGISPGGFSAYFNQLLVSELAVNSIGEINQLCFNDFLQVFLELGIAGILGLGLIFAGLLRQNTVFYLLAMGMVLCFMYPLQYLESAILFALTASVLRPLVTVSGDKLFQLSHKQITSALLMLTMTCLGYIFFLQVLHASWSGADKSMREKNTVIGLRTYKEVSTRFGSEDIFYLRYGLHLKQQQDYNSALRILNRANSLNPSYQSFIYVGDSYFDLGFYAEALDRYKIAQLVRPKHLYPVYKSIFALINSNQTEEAKDYWSVRQSNFEKIRSPVMEKMYYEIESLLKAT